MAWWDTQKAKYFFISIKEVNYRHDIFISDVIAGFCDRWRQLRAFGDGLRELTGSKNLPMCAKSRRLHGTQPGRAANEQQPRLLCLAIGRDGNASPEKKITEKEALITENKDLPQNSCFRTPKNSP